MGVTGSVGLPETLGHSPLPCRSIYCDGGPAIAVLVAEVDQQGVGVVLHTEPVRRICFFVKSTDHLSGSGVVGDK